MSGGSKGATIGTIVGLVVAVAAAFFSYGASLAAIPAILSAASAGAALGGAVGSAIDPPKGANPTGPRLSDLSVQSSAYGAFIGRTYGTNVIFGNLFWLENGQLKESAEAAGGKGGGGAAVDIFTYTATFALGLCEGPITGVRRIWIGPKLVYDLGSPLEDVLIASIDFSRFFKVYRGDEEQLPDPRMQMTLGFDNVPGYRGLAYIVFLDLPLKDYGNSLVVAQIKVEVVKDGGLNYIFEPKGASNTQKKVWDCVISGDYAYVICGYDPGYLQIFNISDTDNPVLEGQIETQIYGRYIGISGGYAYVGIDGNSRLQIFDVAVPSAPFLVNTVITGYGQNIVAVSGFYAYVGLADSVQFLVIDIANPASTDALFKPRIIGSLSFGIFSLTVGDIKIKGAYAYIITNLTNLLVVSVAIPEAPALVASAAIDSGVGGPSACAINGDYLYLAGTGDTLQIFDISTPDTPVSVYASAILAGSFGDGKDLDVSGQYLYVGGSGKLKVFRLETAITPALIGDVGIYGGGTNGKVSVNAQGYYIAVTGSNYYDGYVNDKLQIFFFLEPTIASDLIPLSEIVEAETLHSNLLQSADIDVTSLTPLVRGYKIGAIGAIKAGIQPLQGPWPFDVVQHGYRIKFLLRGGASSVAAIPSDKLDARSASSQPGVVVTNSREMDSVLPVKVVVNHIDQAREYDLGEQYEERLNTDAVNVIALDLPLVLTSDEAKQTAQMLLYLYWQERYDVAFNLPNEYSYLEPADIVTVITAAVTYQLRLVGIQYTSDGRLECKAKYHRSEIYTEKTAKAESGIFTGSAGPLPAGTTLIELLDIPLMADSYDSPGFPVAMTGRASGWPGGVLYRSDDGGEVWDNILAFKAPGSTSGFALDSLAAHSGTTLDKSGVLTVRLYQGELSSVSEAQLFAGQNWFAYGKNGRWEIIAAQNCVLNGDNTYTLTDFLRGQMGTEWASGLHAAFDKLIPVSTANLDFISVNSGSIGLARLYRGVTAGKNLDTATDTAYTYQGVNLECLSPCQLTGSRHPSTNDWTLTWTRRSRFPGWRSLVDAALGEATESYEIDIFSSSTYATLKRTLTAATGTVAYTSSQQVTDFGSNQGALYLKIYQLSAVVGRGYAAQGMLVLYMGKVKWRLLCHTAQSGGANIAIAGVEMRTSWGGANVCSGGTIYASYNNGSYPKENAFDNNASTFWWTISNEQWIEYEFSQEEEIREIVITARNDGYYVDSPKDFEVQYYNGFTYVSAHIITGAVGWTNGESRVFSF
jgi:hypothetical protein